MNKEKSSKSCGSALTPAAALTTSRMVVMKAMVLDVKKSNDDVVTLKVKSEKRYLVVDDNNKVYSISPNNIDKLPLFDNCVGTTLCLLEKNGETKVSHVKHAKSSIHKGKKCVEFRLSKKDIKAKGVTAREATNLDDILEEDHVTVTMVSQRYYWDYLDIPNSRRSINTL